MNTATWWYQLKSGNPAPPTALGQHNTAILMQGSILPQTNLFTAPVRQWKNNGAEKETVWKMNRNLSTPNHTKASVLC